MSSRLWDEIERERLRGDTSTIRDHLRQHPAAASYRPLTLAETARRCASGEDFSSCVREFLDDFSREVDARQAMIDERPQDLTDPRHNAYLGALAEHLAYHHGLGRPEWAGESSRFLGRFWFPSNVKGFRALAIVESPAAFRRRGIFIARNSLDRC